MSDMMEQIREMVNNLEEAWGNIVEEQFGGNDDAAIQVITPEQPQSSRTPPILFP